MYRYGGTADCTKFITFVRLIRTVEILKQNDLKFNGINAFAARFWRLCNGCLLPCFITRITDDPFEYLTLKQTPNVLCGSWHARFTLKCSLQVARRPCT